MASPDAAVESVPACAPAPAVAAASDAVEEAVQPQAPPLVALTVHLPDGGTVPMLLDVAQSTADVAQVLVDTPTSCFYTAYQLRLRDAARTVLPEAAPLAAAVEALPNPVDVDLVPQPYTERLARLHVLRVRNLLEGGDVFSGSPISDLVAPTTFSNSPDVVPTDDEKASAALTHTLGAPKSLADLYPASFPYILPAAVDSIQFSAWNPPPRPRQLHGDLFYIVVEARRGTYTHVTASTRGFYVNRSTFSTFDPTPAANSCGSSTLIGLLLQLEPTFAKRYEDMQEAAKTHLHPLASIFAPVPLYPWAVKSGKHAASVSRSAAWVQQALDTPEMPGQMRDWNEEYQLARSRPRGTIEERITRDREIFRVQSEFLQTAIAGAVQIVNGNLPALNPGDPMDARMFLHHNIFYCFARDSREAFPLHGGDAAAHYAASKDWQTVVALDGLELTTASTVLMTVVDYCGWRVTAQSVVPGILREGGNAVDPANGEAATGEAATSEPVNQEAVKSIEPVKDDEGSEPAKGDSMIVYGSIDNGATIGMAPAFVSALEAIGEVLHLQRHTVTDDKGVAHELPSSLEWKGIVGGDHRRYLIDLYRATPLDVNFLADVAPGVKGDLPTGFGACLFPADIERATEGLVPYVHRLPLFRLEFISYYAEHIQYDELRTTIAEAAKKHPEGTAPLNELLAEIKPSDKPSVLKLNPDLFVLPRTTPADAVASAEGQAIIAAAQHLREVLLPSLAVQLATLQTLPLDSAQLTLVLHAHGINCRYLGELTRLLLKRLDTEQREKAAIEFAVGLVVTEMIVRGAKHVWRAEAAKLSPDEMAPFSAHFLSCFLSSSTEPTAQATPTLQAAAKAVNGKNATSGGASKKKKSAAKGAHGKENASEATTASVAAPPLLDALPVGEWARLTPKGLWGRIQTEVRQRFRFAVDPQQWAPWAGGRLRGREIALLRAVCLKTGIQVGATAYDFARPFTADDIVGLVPTFKFTSPRATDAQQLFEVCRVRLAQTDEEPKVDAIRSLLQDTLAIFTQVYTPVHPEVVTVHCTLALLLYRMGQHEAAIFHQQKAAMLAERAYGLDHHETARIYANLAIFCHGHGRITAAVRYMERAWLLNTLICGSDDHPDLAIGKTNTGFILQSAGDNETATKFLLGAAETHKLYLGELHPQLARDQRLLARHFALKGDFKRALQEEKKVYRIYLSLFGEGDQRTQDSDEFLKNLTDAAVKTARSQQEQLMRRIQASGAMMPMPVGASGDRTPRRGNNKTESSKAAPPLARTSTTSASSSATVTPANMRVRKQQ